MPEPESREAYHAAARLSRAARDLMQHADFLDRPADSYSILGNVLDAARSLEVALGQLAQWHRSAGSGLRKIPALRGTRRSAAVVSSILGKDGIEGGARPHRGILRTQEFTTTQPGLP